MNISVIVCAAGRGERAGFDKNKLMAPLNGAPVLHYTLSAFEAFGRQYTGGNTEKIVVCAEDDAETTVFCRMYGWKVVRGGRTRTESVYNALKCVTGDMVIIHDGARPFVTQEIIKECVECAKVHKSAVCAAPATDTTVISDDGYIASVPQRSTVFCVQTPQVFFTDEIKRAYETAIGDGLNHTDDSSVYSRYIRPAKLCVCGTPQNRKLTFKSDFDSVNAYPAAPVTERQKARVGFGVDVHAFGKKQDYITLCGVKIPCDSGLIAHSDGDVAVHAVMDALLSGAGLKDIGHYFPDSDDKYKNADSVELLKKVVKLIGEKGLAPVGLSVAVQAEKPRLSSYIDDMIAVLASATGLNKGKISITAGTCEGLGFVGEKRGVCAYCTAVLNEVFNG